MRPTARLSLLLAFALSVGAALPAWPQRGGTIEVVPLGRYSFYPDSLGLKSGFGIGAEVGLFVTEKLSLELGGSYGATTLPDSTPVTTQGLTGRLLVHLPLRGSATALFGAGYSRHRYFGGLDVDQEGLAGLVGFRFGFGPRLGLRLEATADYVAPPGGQVERQWDLGVQVGMSMYAGPLGPRDSDHDGVPNAEDRCPESSRGAPVDPTGCDLARDSDGDGVLDGGDQCPDTPPGQRVDLTGCNADSDGDGVLNAVDRCPATPPGVITDPFGCPPPQPPVDSDDDGVPDDRDRCPGTRPDAPVDALGCPLPQATPAPTPERPPPLVLRGVDFPSGSATLTGQAKVSLRTVAIALMADPAARYAVDGYTDDTGPPEANRRISLARATAVRRFLISEGVAADRLSAHGYGSADPVASNSTAEGRARNRRVVLQPIE
ncbi:MAG TPA: OmpA family protein [Gemmatimonadales bacterium]|nr:OmpA family protein [Gemmatimonadales bacterium]